MTKKKTIRKPIVTSKKVDKEKAIADFVNKSPDVKVNSQEVQEKRITVRIPKTLAKDLEEARKPPQSMMKMTTNAWIAQAIVEKLERDRK